MKVTVVAIGRPRRPVADAIEEYEARARRYWSLDIVEVRAVKGTDSDVAAVRRAESKRLLERVPAGSEVVLLTRLGERWSSADLARYLEELALRGRPGAAFLIGGAAGVDEAELGRVDRPLSLSGMTLPHEIARLVLAEQLYRAGTILRGEPYHKGGG